MRLKWDYKVEFACLREVTKRFIGLPNALFAVGLPTYLFPIFVRGSNPTSEPEMKASAARNGSIQPSAST